MTNADSKSPPSTTKDNGDNGEGTNPILSFLTSIQPTHLMLASSLPLCIGAYAGYRFELSRVTSAASSAAADSYSPGFTSSGTGLLKRVMGEELFSEDNPKRQKNVTKKITTKATTATKSVAEKAQLLKINPGRVAFGALGIGSLLSVGGFGLLTFVIFKAAGCDTLDELLGKCRKWTPTKRKQMEQSLGLNPKSLQHEDVKATAGMSDDEEWEFIKKKYIPELVDETD